MTLVVFDVCDTLYRANTTAGFLHHLGGRHSAVARGVRRWTTRRSPWFVAGAVAHRLGRDLARERMIAALAGLTRSELTEAAESYVAGPLQELCNLPLHQRLREHLADGDRVHLFSSSLDVVIDAIARRLGTGASASVLEFRGEVCTGRLLRDLTGRKLELVEAIRTDDERLLVYTDNMTDRALVEAADEATVVLPPGSSGHRWAGERVSYVRL